MSTTTSTSRSTLAPVLPSRAALHVVAAALLLLACLAFTQLFKASKYRADEVGVPDFEQLVPKQFGTWRAIDNGGAIVDPEQDAAVRRLYTTTLNRTYLDEASGRQIMLSIAYGRDQSHVNQVHTPEQCYTSQGFILDERLFASLPTPVGALPVTRLHSHRGLRVEPLTFWVLVGSKVVRGSRDINLERIKFALQREISDGLIFRVSEITARHDEAFDFQSRFITDLLGAMTPAARARVIGSDAP